MRDADEKTCPPPPLRDAAESPRHAPSSSVQLKAALRGLDYAQQVQLLSPDAQGDALRADLHAKAAAGVKGGGVPLPYQEQIQRSFGRHDISDVVAHTGAEASAATESMGASAYATGKDIALGDGGKDLHTVAHEAAHVVQQKGGVSLSGGVGQSGDRYEQHADAVADLVVQGKSAEGLLDTFAGGGGGGQTVQRKEDPRAICGPAQTPVDGPPLSSAEAAHPCLTGDPLRDHSEGAIDIAAVQYLEDARRFRAELPALEAQADAHRDALKTGCRSAVQRAMAWATAESKHSVKQFKPGITEIVLDNTAAMLGLSAFGPIGGALTFVADRIATNVSLFKTTSAVDAAKKEIEDTGEKASDLVGEVIAPYMSALDGHRALISVRIGRLQTLMDPTILDDLDDDEGGADTEPRRGATSDSLLAAARKADGFNAECERESGRLDEKRTTAYEGMAQRQGRFRRTWAQIERGVADMGRAVETLAAVADDAYGEMLARFIAAKAKATDRELPVGAGPAADAEEAGAPRGRITFTGRILRHEVPGVGVFPKVVVDRFDQARKFSQMTNDHIGESDLSTLTNRGLEVVFSLEVRGGGVYEFRQSPSGGRSNPAARGMEMYRNFHQSPLPDADIPTTVWDTLSRAPIQHLFPGGRVT